MGQIRFRDGEAILGGGKHVEPGDGGISGIRAAQQEAIGRVFPPAHTAPQLMELGKAEAVGVLDGHHGGVGHIHPHLDHGGGHQHLDLPARKAAATASFSLGGCWPWSRPKRTEGKAFCSLRYS